MRRLEEYAKGKGRRYEVIAEVASGVNENRRGLKKQSGQVEKVVIEYPDRLARRATGWSSWS